MLTGSQALRGLSISGCTGLEVLSRLRIQVSQLSVPCIFYSGEAGEGLERQARNAGAFAFLRKPVQPDVLRIEVRRALDFVHGDRRSARGRAGDL